MHNIETIDKLLKDELAATETYKQALDKLREDAALGESEYLMPIYEAHKDAVSSLQAQIRQLGETPSEGSGAWGSGWKYSKGALICWVKKWRSRFYRKEKKMAPKIMKKR